MTKPGWLKAGGILHSHEDLMQGVSLSMLTAQEKNAIHFCSSWLSGQAIFDFQTSGSTGVPKKVSFTRDQLIVSAMLTEKALQYQSGETALVCLDVKFIAGAMMLVRSLVSGLNIVVVTPSSDPFESVTDKIDFVAMVPLQVTTLLSSRRNPFHSMKSVIVGGAPLDKSSIESLQNVSASVYATYGMTETITHIALQKLNGSDRQDSFQALPGVILDTDSRGCLTIQADHLGNVPIITNDLVERIDKDKFLWIGRADRIINSGGVKVQAEKIESIVGSLFEKNNILNRFFAAGIPDVHLGEKVVLIVEGNLSANIEEILRLEFQRLSKYEIPQDIIHTPKFAETATQKIDRLETLRRILK